MTSRFKVVGRLDGSRIAEGTVSIDRNLGLLSVRPLRRRREYVLPLAAVAEIVCTKVIKAEIAAARHEKAQARKVSRDKGRRR